MKTEEEIAVKNKKSFKKIGLIILGLFIFFVFVGAMTSEDVPETTTNTTTNEENVEAETKPEESAEPESLDLDVRSNLLGIKVTNNEEGELKNCEVQINPGMFDSGYKTRVDTINSEGVVLTYGEMTKGGERFNYDTTAVEKVVVTMCNEDTRLGIYEF